MRSLPVLAPLFLLTACNEGRLVHPPPVQVAPVAVILLGPGSSPGMSILDGSLSYDPDDPAPDAISTFSWTLAAPAGSSAVIQPGGSDSLVHLSPDAAGGYQISLQVTDRSGMTSEPATYMLSWMPIEIDGDCVTATCPADAPHPVACDITMEGGDDRGCVAAIPANPSVYFQEGDQCGAGHVSGTMLCATQPGGPLTEANCPINKPVRFYPTSSAGCP